MQFFLNIVCVGCLYGLIGCGTANQLTNIGSDRKLFNKIASSPVFSKHHTGFALYDPESQKWLCQYNSNKYFIPASNTKILTMLTCLHVLGDSIETLRYVIKGDSLLFRGMGDPSFLFSEISASSKPVEILHQHEGVLVYQAGEEIERYGRGWAWDDYLHSYQVEKSVLPIYGNRLKLTKNDFGEIEVIPAYFSDYIELNPGSYTKLSRDPLANAFVVNPEKLRMRDTVEIPFIVSDYEITRILADILKRPVDLSYSTFNSEHAHSVYGAARDSLLKRMMQESDNFIAEQLLMQCAFYMRGTFDSDSAIAVAQQMIMGGSPDPLQWVDGSGVSRYNLFSPRSIVWVLNQLVQLQSMDYLTGIFPAGGQSGTIAEWYNSEPPFVFAKTGTLWNNHSLSGYIRTDSGKWLIFSFMHNNFTVASAEIKTEMERIMLMIKGKY